MVTYQQSTAKVGFYCKRCKRQLRTKICPLHGMDSTIILETTTHIPLPPPGDSLAPAAPAVRNGDAAAPPTQRQTNGVRGNSDFSGQLFSDLLVETQTATDPLIDADPHVQNEPEPQNTGPGNTAPSRNGSKPTAKISLNQLHQKHRPGGIGMAITVILILACGVTFYSFTYPEYARKSLFGQAEKYFAAGQYERALASYQRFARKYPGDPHLATVMGRIDEIAKITAEQQRQAQWLGAAMAKAEQSFRENRLISPREDNTYRYLEEILRQVPSYQPAQELQSRLITKLFDLATRAFEKDQYHEALNYYKTILAIRPDDAAVSAQINRALELKNVDEMLRNLGELAETRAEIRRLRQQRAALKNQIRQAQHRLTELTRPPAIPAHNAVTSDIPARPVPEAAAGVAVAQPSPSALEATLAEAAGATSEPVAVPLQVEATAAAPAASSEAGEIDLFQPITNELGIELLFQNEAPPAASEVAIVEETLIDGGRKEYLYRARPTLPASIQAEEIPMILAECVVGTDGRVEEVNLVSGADDKRINQLAADAFKQFRYKPATYRGKPVRFKALEVLAF